MDDMINYSFIIRITVEPSKHPRLPVEWKGMIQDVISGERGYFKDFEQMVSFISQKTSLDVSEDDPEGQ
jgi:hypothetical protein